MAVVAAGIATILLGGEVEKVEQCLGLAKKPKSYPWMHTVANVGAIGFGVFVTIYGVSEYGPMPLVLISGAASAAIWWVGWSLAACAMEGRGMGPCLTSGLSSIFGGLQKGVIGVNVTGPGGIADKAVGGVLKVFGCKDA